VIEPFLIRAALAGAGVALAAGPLGSFVTWRRMAYFGDATSHAAVLGVALALAAALPIWLGVLAVALASATAASWMVARGQAMDSALGVLAHAALALGLVAVALVPGARIDLSAYLFGDILAVNWADLGLIWTGALAVAALLAWRWGRLLLATLSEDLAITAGIAPERERLILTLALAVTVAVALKVVGALLISALLLIPPAAARAVARSPEAMAAGATVLGLVSVVAGLWLSLAFDTPAGPSVVVAAAGFFALSLPFRR
jgi:zinc transport system permease protein